MASLATENVSILARDVSGQRHFRVAPEAESTVGEMLKNMLARMGLVTRDREGRPLEYRARLEREGRQLNPSEIVGDVLETEDEIVLTPRIQAG